MKKLRFILLSAVLAAVFGFSFIGCSNYSSNGGSSKHDMTIKLKASGTPLILIMQITLKMITMPEQQILKE